MGHPRRREQLVIVHLDDLARDPQPALAEIAAKCHAAHGGRVPFAAPPAPPPAAPPAAPPARAPKLNEAGALPAALEPDDVTLREMAAHYRPHNERLFALLGRDLGWHDDPKYWYYGPAGRG